jgi:hypothetical protein
MRTSLALNDHIFCRAKQEGGGIGLRAEAAVLEAKVAYDYGLVASKS